MIVYKKTFAFALVLVLLGISLLGCVEIEDKESDISEENDGINIPSVDINDVSVKDDPSVYMFDDEGSVVCMYLTVRRGNKTENTDHSWNEVNRFSIFDYETLGVERFGVEAIIKIGDENGPKAGELGFGVYTPNAIVQVRGNTTSRSPQKSFKIELKRDKGEWREQRTIALNKHPYDETRILNKLCYDLLKEMPDAISARTQFIHLFVKDETGSDAKTSGYVDYGLFTQVEQFNKRYLENHGLDKEGHLYKAEMFEYHRSEDIIKPASDPDYNLEEFEKILEVKGNNDHTKLIAMLEDINNYSVDIEESFSKHFDEENYFTWLAFNILIGNVDSINRNFFLYSLQNANKWYLIPWDIDGAFSRTIAEYTGKTRDYGHEIGISNYWGCILHRRVLSNEKFRKKLDEKIEDLRQYLSRERISGLIDTYKPAVKPLIYSMPDIKYAGVTEDEYDGLLESLLDEIELNYNLYKESLERPMPFFIDLPSYDRDKMKITWGVAYDFRDEDITYDVQIARDLAFTDIIASFENIDIPIVNIDKLTTGQYFIKVKATNSSGKEQYAQDYYLVESVKHYGISVFYVLPDGSIGQ